MFCLSLLLAAVVTCTQAPAASSTPVAPGVRALDEVTAFLLGDWAGEGTGQAGEAGRFTFERALDGHAVIRRSHTPFPATRERPAFAHDDLLLMFAESGQLRATYVDNEGHVIRYHAAFDHGTGVLTFESEAMAGQPRFRLIYTPLSKDRVAVAFEIAVPEKPDAFSAYLKGTARRVR